MSTVFFDADRDAPEARVHANPRVVRSAVCPNFNKRGDDYKDLVTQRADDLWLESGAYGVRGPV